MVFVIPEGRHEVVVGESGGIEIWNARVVGKLDGGVFLPMTRIVREYDLVVGNIEINLKNAVAELII